MKSRVFKALLALVSAVLLVIGAAVLVLDAVLFRSRLGMIYPPELVFLSWFFGWFEMPSAFYPLLLTLAGAGGLYLAFREP
jgi:hypothetical protein